MSMAVEATHFSWSIIIRHEWFNLFKVQLRTVGASIITTRSLPGRKTQDISAAVILILNTLFFKFLLQMPNFVDVQQYLN